MVEVLPERTTAEVTTGIDPRGGWSLTKRIELLGSCNPEDLEVFSRYFLPTNGKPPEVINSGSIPSVP